MYLCGYRLHAQDTMYNHLIMCGGVVLCIPGNIALAVAQFLFDEKFECQRMCLRYSIHS